MLTFMRIAIMKVYRNQ